jgi:hypothetical protein
MKVDFDSILYIVITILILVISGLSSRRRKRVQQIKTPQAAGGDRDTHGSVSAGVTGTGKDEDKVRPAGKQARSPIDRLEKYLSEQVFESMEGESLEPTVDEEEQILREINQRRQAEDLAGPVQEPMQETVDERLEKPGKEMPAESLETEKLEKKSLFRLFENADDIKKAIIYSEILKRRYE